MTTEPTIIEKIGNITNITNSDNEWTSIRISRRTLDLLRKLGHFKDNWEKIIQRLAAEKLGLETPEDNRSF